MGMLGYQLAFSDPFWCIPWNCNSYGVLGQVWYLIVSIPDLSLLSNFASKTNKLMIFIIVFFFRFTFKHDFKISTYSYSVTDPVFQERGFICIKGWGFALLILSHIS